MKKGWKIFLIICGSITGIGLGLCIAGAAMGATFFGVREAYGGTDYVAGNEGTDYISSNGESVSDFQGIREIDVEVTYLRVIIKEGEGDDVLVDASQVNSRLRDRLVYGQESGELKIETEDHAFWKKIDKTNAGKLIIQLPKDRAMEEVTLEIGVGQLTIEQINAGALDINVGAGLADVERFKVKDLTVDCGAGQARLSGEVTHKAEVDCGVGEVEMNLTGSQKDYDYELDCGIGELEVGTDSYTGLGGEQHIDYGTGRKMKISCGIGKVDVSFGEGL